MTNLYIIIILALFAAAIYGFYWMQKKHVKFSTRVFSALGAGIVLGAIIQVILGAESEVTIGAISWINIVGNGYVSLLQMLVMPLIFVSIVGAFTKLGVSKNLGKISFTVIGTLLATTAVAALIGILSVFIFNLDGATFVQGEAETARIEALGERQEAVENLSIPEQVVSFIPTNVFADLSGSRSTSTIAVVIFSAFIGIAYMGVNKKDPETGEFFAKLINSLYKIVMRIVTLVLRLTPYGILALMIKVTATSDVRAIWNLGKFVLASYSALAVVFIMHLLILLVVKVNPLSYIKKASTVLGFAFTSRSSAGAIPLNIETQTKALGVDEASANFAASFGATIGQNGCAGVYPAMLAAIVAPTVGIDVFSPLYILTIIAVVTISSFGVAGVGGGATFASLIVLGSLNLPIAIVGLVISVEPLIDMARTLVNVSDSMIAGIVTSKRIKEFDETVLNDEAAVIESSI
ncbi:MULTISPECIES: L-cystine transporter [Carnobacterium]|jgi:L-cystine uptake protein TcyP (sodium:dicarboxylate symporter family)|uniref:L-cystine uptake protein TcyP n=2 Tax=Carnobacterium maltaromaticum TaxID=2751 RepID=K8ENL6_CARML|nr:MULTISPECIES: L-cystine transporter [Carnobacterium]AOA01095.1 sodium:dicarboxylate symporter [Carnobacterium maltaromaticum]KRN60552.1 sodium-cystine symporter [Carnobacterium maltaromaticum DSM 20342]KRN84751.1 sodium-cystine symporter [Carnobacterium maltaromaticum]MBC9789638.1 cation:dicarboxylase symporter family transporter [Carnobacterium maltaromaticum]MBQ6483807.1 L-cystine transporter [Carnobacterium sp.]